MNPKWIAAAFFLLFLARPAVAQNSPEFMECVNAKQPFFLNVNAPSFLEKLAFEKPASDEAFFRGELKTLHDIQDRRTPEQAVKAATDANELDIFIFRDLFGTKFDRRLLKTVASLSDHVCADSTVVANILKYSYTPPRLRPFLLDHTLKPVCDISYIVYSPSYPSGHTITGYLEALALSEIFPAKREDILKRAGEYSRNRNVCGVHYPSDVEGGRKAAYAVFEFMKASPYFQSEVNAARDEIQRTWGIDPAKYGAPEKDAAQ